MAERIVLHIGAPKTGTTFLQAVLFHNRERLARDGVLVPGQSRRDHGRASTGARQGKRGKQRASWEWMVGQAHGWPGTVVVSNEWFSRASARHARRVLGDLGPDRTHVVFTARDFVEQVPAAWQETVKLGVASSLDDFLRSLEREGGRWRWSVLDPASVLDRWGADLPTERVHVVTVPPRGSDAAVLWRRFAQVCDIDPAGCDLPSGQGRQSLGAEAARLLQRIGPQLREAIDADNAHWSEPYRWILGYVAHELLLPHGGSRIWLRPGQVSALRARSSRTVEALLASGWSVVGDLGDLTSAEPPGSARHPDDVTDADLLSVALPLIADLLTRVRREALQVEALQAAYDGRVSEVDHGRRLSDPA